VEEGKGCGWAVLLEKKEKGRAVGRGEQFVSGDDGLLHGHIRLEGKNLLLVDQKRKRKGKKGLVAGYFEE